MPLGLRATALPSSLTSSYATPEENAAMAIQAEQDQLAQMSAFERAAVRSGYQVGSSVSDLAGQFIEPLSPGMAQPMFDTAKGLRAGATRYNLPTDIHDTDNIHSVSDFGNYLANVTGEQVANAAVSIPVGLAATAMLPEMAGLGLAGTFARNYIGQSIAAAPLEAGNHVGRLRDDKQVMTTTTPSDRLANSLEYGALSGATEGLGDALLVGRLGGAGKAVTKTLFKDGVGAAAKSAAAHTALAIPEAALTEGVPEILQEKAGQVLHSQLNPNRDTSGDAHDLKESFLGGWAAGGTHSVAGRGANVAWSNTRDGVQAGANALGKLGDRLDAGMQRLRAGKVLPPNLKSSDDATINAWDKADDAERNTLGSKLADSVLADDNAPSYLRDKAIEFYDRIKAGASNAWESMAGGVKQHDTYQRSKDSFDHFVDSVKKTSDEFGGKANAESSDADNLLYETFRSNLDPKSHAMASTEYTSKLFQAVKQALQADDVEGTDWHRLADQYENKGASKAAIESLRAEMVRHGQLDDDPGFAARYDAATKFGASGDAARAEIVKRYSPYGGQLSQADAVHYARTIAAGLVNYPRMSKDAQVSFDRDTKSFFGNNYDKAIDAFGPRQTDTSVGSLADTEESHNTSGSQQTITETEHVKPRFIGSATQNALAAEPGGNDVKGHGGMWNLANANEKTRDEIKARMKQTVRTLRNDGNTVKILTPLEYAEAAGVAPGKIAQSLGTSVDKLKGHPSRMLMVTREGQVGLNNLGDEMTSEHIAALGEATHYGQAPFASKILTPEQATAAKAALSKRGGEARKAMTALGLPNGVRLEETPKGTKLHNNQDHGGNGRFTVEMKDGAKHVISAQELIRSQRKSGQRGSALQHFNAGVAAIMSNKDVVGVKVHDIWGREHKVDEKNASLGVFGPHFRIEPDLTLGKAQRATQKGSAQADAVDAAAAGVSVAEQNLDEALKADTGVDEAEQALDDAKQALVEAEATQAMYEGTDDRPAVVGEKVATDTDMTPTEHQGEKVQDFNDDGSPKHPYGARADDLAPTTLERGGITLNLRGGVSASDVTPAMNKVLRLIHKATGLVGDRKTTLNVAADYVARAAAAQHDGNTKARDALLLTAQHRLWSALADASTDIGRENGGEMSPERVALAKLAAIVDGPASQYEANREKTIKNAQGYEGFVEKKVAEEAPPVGSATKPVKKVDGAPKANDLNPLHKKAPSAYAPGKKATEEKARSAEAAAFDKLIDNLVEGVKAGKLLGGNLKDAFNTLEDALRNGELNKPELVAQLREALKNLRAAVEHLSAAALEGMRRVTKAVQEGVKKYQEAARAAKNSDTVAPAPGHKFNAESSAATGGSVTEADMVKAREYLDKVLGPQVKLLLTKDLGGNSASWERVSGEAVIKIALSATTPQSKVHHEAMHEFFQRLIEANPEIAEVLTRSASSAAVVRQIEQFFHNDANYDKIKSALVDPHERVAYMYQLWAAGKLNLGPKTEGVFAKVAAFIRKVTGMLSGNQHTEAILEHFHNGEMSTQSDVARVLSSDKTLRAEYIKQSAAFAEPLYKAARQLIITAQNELTDSGNKGLESIGRLMSNETGSADKNISFMSARVMKTNQMTDRLFNILKGLDQKDLDAALEGLQTGVMSKDAKIAGAQHGIRKMLDQIHDYLTEKQGNKPLVDIKKVDNYFPQAWDSHKISENKPEFVSLLMKDGGLDEAAATRVANKLIENRGAAPLTEGEYRVGFTPFMAAANHRVLDFIKSPEFAKFQKKDLIDILTTYIAHAAHRAEYARRFGENGEGLRSMVKGAVGEAVGTKEWNASEKAEEAKLADTIKALKEKNTNSGKFNFDQYNKDLAKAGYPAGEVEITHIARNLDPEAMSKFKEFSPQLRRAQRAIMAMEGTLGYDVNPLLRKMTSGIIVYENMRLLTMSLFSQIIDPAGIIVRGGTLSQAFDTFKRGLQGTVAGWKGTPMEDSMTKLAMQLGIVDAGNFLNSQGQSYSGVFMGHKAKWFNDRLFRVNGVEGYSQGTRVGAMVAAISFIKTHANPKSSNEHSARYLEELGLTKDDVTLAGDELDFTNKKIQEAIFRWVDGAIIRPNAAMRPSWSSDPHYALLFHMKQFTYAFQKILIERAVHEAKHGNLDPVMGLLLSVPAIMASDMLRGLITNGGQEPPWKRKWKAGDYVWSGVERAGLLGIPQIGGDIAKWGPGEAAGPFAEQLIRSAKNYTQAYDRDMKLDEKAAQTHSPKDQAEADAYKWLPHATKKTLRMAIPTGDLIKKAVYDPLVSDIK